MHGPLTGVRVLDLSRVLAGPYCSMILGDLGADVIKVERPGVGDETRHWGPPFVAPGQSAYYVCTNRNKRSIAVDLKSPDGVALIKDLARVSDVFIENFSPGTTDELGVGYDAIRAINPRIIYCSITGFGPDGPYKSRGGYDLAVSAIGGLMGITGEPDGPPVKVGVAITDVCTGISAQGAICAALYARQTTGVGQRIDLSLLETQVATLVNIASSYLISGQVPKRWGTAHETIVPYQGFEAKDKYVIVAVGNDQLWRKFCRVLGKPELADDPRFKTNPLRVQNRAECLATVGAILKSRTRDEWIALMNAEGIPCSPINAMDEVFADPQVLHRKMVVEVEDPVGGTFKMVGLPVKYSQTEASIRRLPPRLGEHTNEILTELLGYNADRVADLARRGVVSTHEGTKPMGASATANSSKTWWVTFDAAACSICEMCVNKCPQNALTIKREGGWEEILFNHELCDGCGGDMYCKAHCPEHCVAVKGIARQSVPSEPVVLVRGQLAVCSACGTEFMPERKLQTLVGQQKITAKDVQHFCPACRRNRLLDSYIESVRARP